MDVLIGSQEDIEYIHNQYPVTKQVMWRKDGNSYVVVARCDGMLVGFAFVFRRSIPAPVGDLTEDFINVVEVFEEADRRKGITTQIISLVKEQARMHGSIQVRAYCDIGNVASHRLWLKTGFGISPVKAADGSIAGSFVTYRF